MLGDDLRPVAPGVIGKLARRGHVPLGYYKDPVKTADTFPVVDGVRWSVPGDHARIEDDGTITVLGTRIGVDQHRRREGVPRRGGGGAEVARRGVRCGGRRRPRRTLGRAGHCGRATARGRPAGARRPRRARAARSWRRTRCRATWCWSTRSCARRRASPTTAGHARDRRGCEHRRRQVGVEHGGARPCVASRVERRVPRCLEHEALQQGEDHLDQCGGVDVGWQRARGDRGLDRAFGVERAPFRRPPAPRVVRRPTPPPTRARSPVGGAAPRDRRATRSTRRRSRGPRGADRCCSSAAPRSARSWSCRAVAMASTMAALPSK